ncbi:hypothetical protein LCGC14_2655180, partial [marine sediment metagenome]
MAMGAGFGGQILSDIILDAGH